MKLSTEKTILYSALIRNPEAAQLMKKYGRDIPTAILESLAGSICKHQLS